MGLKRPGTVTGASGTAYWARRPLGRLLREDLACRPPAALQHPAALWKGGALRVTCSHQCIFCVLQFTILENARIVNQYIFKHSATER